MTKLREYLEYINKGLEEKYDKREDPVEGNYYVFPDGSAGHPFQFPGTTDIICMEYADDLATAEKGLFPWDGDRLLITEMTKEEMLDYIIQEMENKSL